VHENGKSEIRAGLGLEMAGFEHHYFQEDYDRPLHYQFFDVGGSSTSYSYYWLAWSGLVKPGKLQYD
jgi:hypothetical protein